MTPASPIPTVYLDHLADPSLIRPHPLGPIRYLIAPETELAPWVSTFFVIFNPTMPGPGLQWFSAPKIESGFGIYIRYASLLWPPMQPVIAEGMLVGGRMTTGMMSMTRTDMHEVVCAYFRPGALAECLDQSAEGLSHEPDGRIDHQDRQRLTNELETRLLAEPHAGSRWLLLRAWLKERLRARGGYGDTGRVIQAAFDVARHRPGLPVESIADHLGYSRRQLQRLFVDRVGVTPKRALMIQRFRHAIEIASRAAEVDWALIAAHAGFASQTHLIDSFGAIVDMSPVSFLHRLRTNLLHVPGVGIDSLNALAFLPEPPPSGR